MGLPILLFWLWLQALHNTQEVQSSHSDGPVEITIPVFISSDSNSLTFTNHLSHFHSAWSQITLDQWALSSLKVGHTLQFASAPPSHCPSASVFRDQEVQSLLQLGAIGQVPYGIRGKRFYSCYFLIPKVKGSLRPASIQQVLEKNKVLNGHPSFYYSLPGD